MKRLTENELAQRWDVTTRTLQNWRKSGKGPPFIRIGERSIFYREEDVLGYEDASVRGRLDEPRWRPVVKRAAAAIDILATKAKSERARGTLHALRDELRSLLD